MSKETNHSKALKAGEEIHVEILYRIVKKMQPQSADEIANIIEVYFPSKQHKAKKVKSVFTDGGK